MYRQRTPETARYQKIGTDKKGKEILVKARAGIKLRVGETIEAMIRRMVKANEPIESFGVLMTEVDEDRMKVTDITADKFDNALEAKSKVVQLGYEGRAKEKAAAEAAAEAKKATNE